jgi:hypothetical protein
VGKMNAEIAKKMKNLIGKTVDNIEKDKFKITFKMTDGFKLTLEAAEFNNWCIFEYFVLQELLGKEILDLQFKDNEIWLVFDAETCLDYATIRLTGFKQLEDFYFSNDKEELILEMENFNGNISEVFYYKSNNRWKLAVFNQNLDSVHCNIAKEKDLINDPKIRLELVLK